MTACLPFAKAIAGLAKFPLAQAGCGQQRLLLQRSSRNLSPAQTPLLPVYDALRASGAEST